MPSAHEITELLQAWSGGDPQALDRLTPLFTTNYTGAHSVIWRANDPTTRCKPLL
jgi:hypothetical protein